jgi:O-antigen/teichoic acid export membrane protein
MQSLRIVNSQTMSVLIQVLIQIFLLIVLLLFINKNLKIAVLAISTSYLFSFIYVLNKSQLSVKTIFNSINRKTFRYQGTIDVMNYGIPLAVWFFSTQLFTLGDRIILNFYNLKDGLGLYSSYRDLLTGGFSLFTMPLLLASHPIIMKMWSKNVDRNKIEHILSENVTLIILLFIPILLFIHEFGSILFLRIMHYKSFDGLVAILIILSIMTSAIGIYAQKGLEVTGNTKLMAKVAILVVFISLGLNFYAIGMWGIKGMAIINLISQLFYLSIVYSFARKTLQIKIRSISLLYIFLFCVLSELLFYFLPGVNSFILMLLYLSVLFIVFMILPETRHFINIIFGLLKSIYSRFRFNSNSAQ